VDNSKLAADSVTTDKIVNGTILSNDIASSTINYSLIYPATISSGLIASNGIKATNITDHSIYNYHLAEPINSTNIVGSITNNFGTNTVWSTNIGPAAVSNANMAALSINYTNLGTNVSMLVPRLTMFISKDRVINYQVNAPGTSNNTVVSNDVGYVTVNFGTAFSNTNYVVNASCLNDGTVTTFISVQSNTVSRVSFHTENNGGADVNRNIYLTIWGQ